MNASTSLAFFPDVYDKNGNEKRQYNKDWFSMLYIGTVYHFLLFQWKSTQFTKDFQNLILNEI